MPWIDLGRSIGFIVVFKLLLFQKNLDEKLGKGNGWRYFFSWQPSTITSTNLHCFFNKLEKISLRNHINFFIFYPSKRKKNQFNKCLYKLILKMESLSNGLENIFKPQQKQNGLIHWTKALINHIEKFSGIY